MQDAKRMRNERVRLWTYQAERHVNDAARAYPVQPSLGVGARFRIAPRAPVAKQQGTAPDMSFPMWCRRYSPAPGVALGFPFRPLGTTNHLGGAGLAVVPARPAAGECFAGTGLVLVRGLCGLWLPLLVLIIALG